MNPIEKVVFELDYEPEENFIVRLKKPCEDKRISIPTAYVCNPKSARITAESYAKIVRHELEVEVSIVESRRYLEAAQNFS